MKKQILSYCLLMGFTLIFGQVGIGTDTPHSSAVLDMQSNNKGFLPSRIAIQSKNDAITIPQPATGLLVYNTNSSNIELREGLVINTGTPASPVWESLTYDDGVEIGKLIYTGTTENLSQTLKIGGFEFSFTIAGGNTVLRGRLLSQPTTAVTISGFRMGWTSTTHGRTNVSATWNTSNWNTWQQVDVMADGASHFFYLKTSISDKFYKISNYVIRNNYNSLIVEIY